MNLYTRNTRYIESLRPILLQIQQTLNILTSEHWDWPNFILETSKSGISTILRPLGLPFSPQKPNAGISCSTELYIRSNIAPETSEDEILAISNSRYESSCHSNTLCGSTTPLSSTLRPPSLYKALVCSHKNGSHVKNKKPRIDTISSSTQGPFTR